MTTAINAFRFKGMWPVNRGVFRDHHFFASVANIRGADFVQPVQAELQDEERKSQVNISCNA